MKSHHRRHSRYLLIALGMVGMIFWYHESPDERRTTLPSQVVQSGATGDNKNTEEQTVHLISKSGDVVGSGENTITSEEDIIIISKDSKPDIFQESEIVTSGGAITGSSIIQAGNEPVISPPTQQKPPAISTGATEEQIKNKDQLPSPQTTALRSPRRTPHVAKKFAYELAGALDVGSGTVLTTVDGYYDTQTLMDTWEQTNDPAIYTVLVERLMSEYRYDEVVGLLEKTTNQWSETTPSVYMQALWGSSQLDITRPETIKIVVDVIENLHQTTSITSEQYERQKLLVRVRREGVGPLIQQKDAIPQDAMRQDIESVVAYYKKQQAVPEYYRDALVAMVLAQHGYFALAQKIATAVSLEDSQYLLPLQIMAQSTFVQRHWVVADTYITQLMERDPGQTDFYEFVRGVIAYRQGRYTDAVLTLRQVENPHYIPDAVRYMALAYDHVDDDAQRNQMFASLLQYALDPSDYYTYFYTVFFQSFQESSAYTYDEDITKTYIRRCLDTLQGDARIVCEYGAAGVLLAKGEIDRAHRTLTHLYEQQPYSYIARALGDYYMMQGEEQNAVRYYYLALRSTDSSRERSITQDKLRQLTQKEKEVN